MNQPVKETRYFLSNASSSRRGPGKIIFITGTDTGVGKTILTGLLVQHLRFSGVHTLAMKPFCSGGRADVRLLRAMQDGELTEEEINPFYFPEAIAPLVSARRHKRLISLAQVIRRIKEISRRCKCLLVEGSGGLLVPLGEGYLVLDLIRRLDCEVIVVARNRLGTINHTLLTINALRDLHPKRVQIALMMVEPGMRTGPKDASTGSNLSILSEFCDPVPVRQVENLGKNSCKINGLEGQAAILKKSAKKIKKTLASFFP